MNNIHNIIMITAYHKMQASPVDNTTMLLLEVDSYDMDSEITTLLQPITIY